MSKILNRKLLTVLLIASGFMLCAEPDKGTFFPLKNTPNLKGMRGLALKLSVKNTAFQYSPAPSSIGVLSDLAMTAYAVSHDNSILALAESVKEKKNTYFNRIVFMEYARFKVVNGIEFTSQGKITNIFFFYNKLFFVTEGDKTQIQAIVLSSNLKLFNKTLNIPDGISNICCGKTFFYVKCLNKKLMQIDDALQVNSTIDTRHNGGLLYIRGRSDTLCNFTKENIEYLKKNNEGIFKSNYRDLPDKIEPEKIFIPPREARNFYFTSKGGRLYKMIDSSHCEEIDVSPFQDIFLHTRKNEFYLLAKKKQQIEIVRFPDFRVRKRLSHHTMKPETYKFIKFMIPHINGFFIITQNGEFAQIVERRRRFYKYKIQ